MIFSFGVGVVIFSGIQYYNQHPEPSGPFLGLPYAILHGHFDYIPFGYGGTLVWGILMILGFIALFVGKNIDAVDQIQKKIMRYGKEIQETQKKELDNLLNGKDYENLPYKDKNYYDQTEQYYKMVQQRVLELLTGIHSNDKLFSNDVSANAAYQVEQILSSLKRKHDLEL